MQPPFVLISIVSTNDAQHVVNCLANLAPGSHDNFAIYINENGGDAGFESMTAALAARPELVIPRSSAPGLAEFNLQPGGQRIVVANAQGNLGYSGGTNAALAQALITGWDAVWVLNPDTFPEKDALSALVARQATGNYGMVGSRLLFVASGLVQTWGGLSWRPWLGRGKLIGFREPADARPNDAAVEAKIDFVSGASMYVTRDYVTQVGGMDADFFVFCEDVEWCLRGRDRFRFGYAHDSIVHHIHGGTSGSSTVRNQRSRFNIYLSERNKVLLARKRLGAGAPLAIMLCLLGLSEYLLRDRSLAGFRHGFHGWLAGLRGEAGAPPWMRTVHRSSASQSSR